ncbi:CBS domain protein [uncultured Desulfobacterium sp.]|uniref:CBS domain protein n=1 Tax=uncultured Desulfobacterium sp. TaxID=201089 RepID=A0A445MTF2_9BACT|nr:CBS domain protein [uncultured Desulfobacterium sp.]
MLNLKAKDIMTKEVLRARADWSLARLSEFLFENSISGAPVFSEDDRLLGVVSSTDIISKGALPENDLQSNPHEYYLHNLERRYSQAELSSLSIAGEPLVTVGDIMTPVVFLVNEDASLKEVADTMIKNRIHRIFVINDDKVAGVISTADMLQVIRDM